MRLGDVLQAIESESEFPDGAIQRLHAQFCGRFLGEHEFDALIKVLISKETQVNSSERMKFI